MTGKLQMLEIMNMPAEIGMNAALAKEAESRGVVTEIRVVETGNTAEAICEAADRFSADLVCIGTHGPSDLAATVLGSVAQAVIAHSPRPELVVRSALS